MPRMSPAIIVKTRAGIRESLAADRTRLVNCRPAPVRAMTPITIPAQAQAIINQNSANADFVVLDLRTPSEYASGHIAGATNLDYYSVGFLDGLNGLDKSQTYLIYCRSGFRSGATMEIMKAVGFREIYHLPAGILGWQAAGLPVVN